MYFIILLIYLYLYICIYTHMQICQTSGLSTDRAQDRAQATELPWPSWTARWVPLRNRRALDCQHENLKMVPSGYLT